MRILFVSTHPHLPEVRGGLQTTTHDLCLTLRDLGAAPAVLSGRSTGKSRVPSGRSWEIDESPGYPVVRADIPEQQVEAFATAWNAAVVVVQSGPRFLRALIAGMDSGRPTVAYLHNVEAHQLDGHLVPDPEMLFLANSAFAAARWSAFAGIRCHVVPPVVRGGAVMSGATGERVLFVNPVPVKGVELMFALAANCPDIPFTVVENWELEPSWRDYCQRRASALRNVDWVEPVDDMRTLYAQSRMLLMPSVWEEAFGRTAIEAQLNGLPVLASDRGALPEVVGAGGVTLAPHAPLAEWIAALRTIYETPAHWSDAARSNAYAHTVSAPAIAADFLTLVAEHALRSAPQSQAGREASGDETPTTPGDLRWRLARLAPTGERTPGVAAEWRALADLHASRRRYEEAEEAVRQAIALAGDDALSWRQLGEILSARRRSAPARFAMERAAALAPADPAPRLALAKLQSADGDAVQALATLDAVDDLHPEWAEAIALRAQVLAEGGRDTEGSPQASWPQVERLLRLEGESPRAVALALRTIGLGAVASDRLPPSGSPEARLHAWREASAFAFHRHGHAEFRRLAEAGASLHPEDACLTAAALHADAVAGSGGPMVLGRRAREWARTRQMRCGSSSAIARETPASPVRPRIAYVAEPGQGDFLRRLIAAHALESADVFLFTNAPWPDIPDGVRVQALEPETLQATCARHAIDVAIACGGLQPHDGHLAVLEAFARRVAPVQAAWLGFPQATGGLFDVLITDEVALPANRDAECDERVLRLASGQWCWDPPATAPVAGPLPASVSASVTFGVTSSSLRLDDRSLTSFARVLARTPGSRLRFIGRIADDFPTRRRVLSIFAQKGVDATRVDFDPHRDLGGFRQWLAGVDVVLDPFTAGAGRSMLETLWMGVPVVVLAGDWLGGRQSASALAAIGAREWIANDPGEYEQLAADLASDLPRLARTRAGLRNRIAASSLVDGRHVASQIEAWARELMPHAAAMRACPDPKDRERLHAAWEIGGWLARASTRLRLPGDPGEGMPDFSVIVVLYGQAGLARRALQALADQRGATFETLIVDNASPDRTPELLDRVGGARVIRNTENLGFLHAVNQAASMARGRHLLLLNSDAVLETGALEALMQALDLDEAIGAVGGRLVRWNGGLQEAGSRVQSDGWPAAIGRDEDPYGHVARTSRWVDYCSGALLATPRALWERLGGFDPAFAPAYYEDVDYCLRIWQTGKRVLYEPRAIARHLEGGSAGPDEIVRLVHANRLRFVERHGAWLEKHGQVPSTASKDAGRGAAAR